jgi:hypothetical protein
MQKNISMIFVGFCFVFLGHGFLFVASELVASFEYGISFKVFIYYVLCVRKMMIANANISHMKKINIEKIQNNCKIMKIYLKFFFWGNIVTLVPQKHGDFYSNLAPHPKKKEKKKLLFNWHWDFFVSPQCENLAPNKNKNSIIFMFSCIFPCTFFISELLKFVLQISCLYLIFYLH